MNKIKTGLWQFSTWGTKNVHWAICTFSWHAGFSQIQSHISKLGVWGHPPIGNPSNLTTEMAIYTSEVIAYYSVFRGGEASHEGVSGCSCKYLSLHISFILSSISSPCRQTAHEYHLQWLCHHPSSASYEQWQMVQIDSTDLLKNIKDNFIINCLGVVNTHNT